MDYLNQNISLNLRRIRLARGYSLDLVAEQTGVSKSMLGQIERGEANPTIGTLGKIVSGLRVELTDLTETPGSGVYFIERKRLLPTKEAAGQYRVYTYFPYEKERTFEIYEMEIEAGASYFSGGHGERTREYITVLQGCLTLLIEGEEYTVSTADAMRFDTERDHIYCNRGQELLRLICVFAYNT
ncbi:MAG: XRE family transcriptional regulator [Blautia sp.]|nr:XRE family transcriptional regulator [Blautia sp.]